MATKDLNLVAFLVYINCLRNLGPMTTEGSLAALFSSIFYLFLGFLHQHAGLILNLIGRLFIFTGGN